MRVSKYIEYFLNGLKLFVISLIVFAIYIVLTPILAFFGIAGGLFVLFSAGANIFSMIIFAFIVLIFIIQMIVGGFLANKIWGWN